MLDATQWGEVVMNQEVGAPIVQAKLDAVSQAVIATCDTYDGITDGIIQDPRACLTDANLYVCGEPGAASLGSNCLTTQEAGAMNKIWNGPPGRGADQQLWFGLERGAYLDGLDGATPFSISTQWLQYWVFRDPAFDWHTSQRKPSIRLSRTSELKFRQVITYHGLADFLIMPRGTYNYYNNATKAEGSLAETQKFYRFFPYPGNSHCGGTMFQTNSPLINSNRDLFTGLGQLGRARRGA